MGSEDQSEPIAIASGSGTKPSNRKTRLRERRSRSSSSSSSSSSSTSSSSSSAEDKIKNKTSSRKRERRRRRRSKTQRRRDRHLIAKLHKDVEKLRKTVQGNEYPPTYCSNDNTSVVSRDIDNDLYNEYYASQASPLPASENPVIVPELTFDIETKLKDPAVPKTPAKFLRMLDEVQRFGKSTWSDIRYAETQKLYNHSPGFTEMESNEEVKAYDTIRHLAYSDKSYAAITYGILKQKEVLVSSLHSLIAWSRTPDAILSDLSDKIDEIFQKGEFQKVSQDLLQMACGHRAETIEMRRDSILKHIRDPLVKATVNKIPPSNTHIFNSEALTLALEKAGGVRKTFWPVNRLGSGNASRGKPVSSLRLPSQGQVRNNVPSHGHSNYGYDPSASIQAFHSQPSQGNYQAYHYNTKGPNNAGPDHRNYNSSNRSSNFRSRGSRQLQRGQKRRLSPSGYRGSKRQRQ